MIRSTITRDPRVHLICRNTFGSLSKTLVTLVVALTFATKAFAQPVLVSEINPGPDGSIPQFLSVANGKLFFNATDGLSGQEGWQYDGTNASLIGDIRPGAIGAGTGFSSYFIEFNGKTYFQADNGVSGSELWSYDGVN